MNRSKDPDYDYDSDLYYYISDGEEEDLSVYHEQAVYISKLWIEANATHDWNVTTDEDEIKKKLAFNKKIERAEIRRAVVEAKAKELNARLRMKRWAIKKVERAEIRRAKESITNARSKRKRSAMKRRRRTALSLAAFRLDGINTGDSNNNNDNNHPIRVAADDRRLDRIDQDDDDQGARPARPHGSVLFIRRVIQLADLNKQQHRLSLPVNRVSVDPDEFFTREELARMREKRSGLGAKLIDPEGREYDIKVRWMMSGPTTYCYGIGKPWLQIVEANVLEAGTVLDVWVSRREETGELWFTLERVMN